MIRRNILGKDKEWLQVLNHIKYLVSLATFTVWHSAIKPHFYLHPVTRLTNIPCQILLVFLFLHSHNMECSQHFHNATPFLVLFFEMQIRLRISQRPSWGWGCLCVKWVCSPLLLCRRNLKNPQWCSKTDPRLQLTFIFLQIGEALMQLWHGWFLPL